MSEIGFYHLTRTPLEAALPKLLGRVLAGGGRAVVRVGDPLRLASLDTSLWLSADPDWLPHGTPQTGHAELQPIWLTEADEAPNGARFLFLVDGAASARLGEYDRVFDLFDGQDEAAVAAPRRPGGGPPPPR
ncbi:DNA polymerase III subunit chi, partial [Teichococcus aerofrigidensis]